MHAQFPIVPRSPCAIILINPKDTCLYLLMGFNNWLGLLVKVEDATSISTILLVDVDVGSSPPYIYMYQPPRLSTPKLPYEEPLVWEISRVVNHIFLILLSPLPLPSLSLSPPRCPARPYSPRQQVSPQPSLPFSNSWLHPVVAPWPCNLLLIAEP